MNLFSFFAPSIDHIDCAVVNRAQNLLTPLVIEIQEPIVTMDPYYSITEDWFMQQNTSIVISPNVPHVPHVPQDTVHIDDSPIHDPIDTVINQQLEFDESKLLELDCEESELENIPDEELDDVVMRLLLDLL